MMVVDAHVHLYPEYPLGRILQLCSERLHALVPDAAPIACLTERHDCHIFKMMLKDEKLDGTAGIEVLENGHSIRIRFGNGVPPLVLVPGRQIATEERIELHCIGKDASIPDGLSAENTVRRILEIEALAVVPWGAGKWMFKRKKVVAKLLQTFSPQDLMLGDSAMRPNFWPEPAAMCEGHNHGYRILAGSDPLPTELSGKWIGRYATVLNHAYNPLKPAQSLLAGMQSNAISRIGKRPGPIAFAQRMKR